MKTTMLLTEPTSRLEELPPQFHMVLIYEDAVAGCCAKRFSDKISHEIGSHCQHAPNFWSFDVLAITNVHNAAAAIARAAEFVPLSAPGERELAPQKANRLDLWVLLNDGGSPALMPIVQSPNGTDSQKILAALRIPPERKRAPFFPQHKLEPTDEFIRAERENLGISADEPLPDATVNAPEATTSRAYVWELSRTGGMTRRWLL